MLKRGETPGAGRAAGKRLLRDAFYFEPQVLTTRAPLVAYCFPVVA